MPAVQTENSDEWPSMEQPQTTEPVSGKKIVIPDFEQKRIEGNVSFRGRIRMITLICIAWRIIKNKDGRKLLHEWEKWKEEK